MAVSSVASGAEQINKASTLNDDARPSMSDENRA